MTIARAGGGCTGGPRSLPKLNRAARDLAAGRNGPVAAETASSKALAQPQHAKGAQRAPLACSTIIHVTGWARAQMSSASARAVLHLQPPMREASHCAKMKFASLLETPELVDMAIRDPNPLPPPHAFPHAATHRSPRRAKTLQTSCSSVPFIPHPRSTPQQGHGTHAREKNGSRRRLSRRWTGCGA